MFIISKFIDSNERTDPEIEEEAEAEESAGEEEEDESTLAGSASSSPSQSPAPLPAAPTAEERAAQLQQTLSTLADERTELTGALKAARRDAQKADAALRAEIEVLKRASEKQVAAESRARQKILALQEAAKQADKATADALAEVGELERTQPALERSRDAKEREHGQVQAEANGVRAEREAAAVECRKRTDSAKAELGALGTRLDKLYVKRDRLEGTTIADLEEQLRELQEEVARVQQDPFGYAAAAAAAELNDGTGEVDEPLHVDESFGTHARHASLTSSRGRGGLVTPAFAMRTSIGRPGPIQRPLAAGQQPFIHHTHHVPHLHQHPLTTTGRSATIAPTSSASSTRKPPSHASSFPPLAVANPSPSVSSASKPSPPAPLASTLSGRAPVFEPRRGGKASDLNPASSVFEPKSILVNPNRLKAPAPGK
jgi:hypothetical protein